MPSTASLEGGRLVVEGLGCRAPRPIEKVVRMRRCSLKATGYKDIQM